MSVSRPWIKAIGIAGVSVAALGPGGSSAFNFTVGELQGALDTDLTYGLSFRTQNPDDGRASPTDRGAYGNRSLFQNRWDIFSNVIKGSHTLELSGSDFGGVVRGNWFYDFEMANQPLPNAAENRAETHGDLTDAYVYKLLGESDNVSIRLGKQVISWGESTFIGQALSDINTVDISKLRTPGADLKDAFLGTPAVDISWTFAENYTLEGFYLFGYDEIKVDPMGSFFTGLDAIADGGGFPNATGAPGAAGPGGTVVSPGPIPRCIAPDGFPCDLLGGTLTRAGDDIPSYGGQYGLAFRIFLPNFGNGGEVGLYYQKLHDHLPMISGFRRPVLGPAGGKFIVDYPEDIERLGASFNTNMFGVALSGEYSWRRNAPIQMLAPLLLSSGVTPVGMAPAPIGKRLKGFERVERHQVQMTVNKNWGVTQWLGADANATLAEVMWGWLGGRPKDSTLMADSDGPGPAPLTPFPNLFEPQISDDFGKLVVRQALTYNAALFNLIALEPSVAFSWDLQGFSNELGGAKLVVEDRKAMTLGLGFLYGGGQWTGNIAYTRFWGPDDDINAAGSRYNGTNDRDFMSVNVSYSF